MNPQEFEKRGGILQPIRSIVSTKYNSVYVSGKRVAEISRTHALLECPDLSAESRAAVSEKWKLLVNQSNIVGYFSAIKNDKPSATVPYDNWMVRIGFSFCKPEDWFQFSTTTARRIAINKTSNIRWEIHSKWANTEADPSKDLVFVFRNLWDTSVSRKILESVRLTKYNHEHDCDVDYFMLGSLEDQLKFFLKRIKRYYKIDFEQ